jgi:hypothetical protein
VYAFSGIFFQVHMVDGYALFFGLLYFKHTTHEYGCCVLACLIAFGQVGVEIMFAVEKTVTCNAAAQGKSQPYGIHYRLPVEHRQGAGVRQGYRRNMRIGLATKSCAIGAKQLGTGTELDVYFKAYNYFVLHARCKGNAFWREAGKDGLTD